MHNAPETDPKTGYLPPGIHDAIWQEVAARFGVNSHRKKRLSGLLVALRNLAGTGCQSILLDGSFVSRKAYPADYDGAWDMQGGDINLVDAAYFEFKRSRAMMKFRYFSELFPGHMMAAPGITYRDFFKQDRYGNQKEIVRIYLGSLP